jgi:hypothetical protein
LRLVSPIAALLGEFGGFVRRGTTQNGDPLTAPA